MTDLSKITMKDTARVELIHPTKGPTGVFIAVRAGNHPKVKATLYRIRISRKISRFMGRNLNSKRIERENMDLLVATIDGWDGLEEGGKPFPFTPKNTRRLLNEPWIMRQVAEAALDQALFFSAQ